MPPSTPIPDYSPHVSTWHDHIRALALDIGPRGPTTDGERRGAQYSRECLEKLGLEVAWEKFLGARSNFQPHMLAGVILFVAFLIYPLAGIWSAALACLLSFGALISEVLELGGRDNLLRRLAPKGESQNVFAVQPPAGEHRQDVILMGHLDSQRTPIIFSTTRWLAVYKQFTTIAFAAAAGQSLLYLLGIFTQWPWIWPVTFISALCALLLAAMFLQADLTPFTHGANDNATAVGLVLALAEHLRQTPLQHTRVWLVCTGCEESQHYGAIDFFARHKSEFVDPHAVVFEMLGCAGPAWLTKEGIVVPFHATPEMVALAEKTARQHPDLDGYPVQIEGGNTETTDALRQGIPAITLMGLTRDGGAPYWHMVTDTFDKIDPAILSRNYAFTWHMIQELDARAM